MVRAAINANCSLGLEEITNVTMTNLYLHIAVRGKDRSNRQGPESQYFLRQGGVPRLRSNFGSCSSLFGLGGVALGVMVASVDQHESFRAPLCTNRKEDFLLGTPEERVAALEKCGVGTSESSLRGDANLSDKASGSPGSTTESQALRSQVVGDKRREHEEFYRRR
jgi:hypothetical protein